MKLKTSHIEKLVQEAQKGNTKAFGEVYDAFFTAIHKYVSYKVSEDHVDDVTATVFIKAWTRLKKYKKTHASFNSWIFRIAHNTVVDHYRTNKEFYELEERIASSDESLHPKRITEMGLNGARVQRALKSLNQKYQEVVVMKYINDLNNKDIADILNTNESNVRTLQHRALKKLKVFLEEEERDAQRKLDQIESEKEPGLLRRLFVRSS